MVGAPPYAGPVMATTSSSALAAAATLVSVAFACCTLERWLNRRKPHEAAWTVALFLFAAGSAALWVATAQGWGEPSFRAFYLFGGVLNVPFLALGTVYLLAGRRLADRVALTVGAIACFAAGVVLVAPIEGPVRPAEFPSGKEYFGVLPRVLAGLGSGLAATVIIGGALWSAYRLWRGRRRPGGAPTQVPAGRLAAANLLIALGTLLISAKGLFEGLGDDETAFAAALASGIVVLFLGFLLTGTRPATGPAPAPPVHVAELTAAAHAEPTTIEGRPTSVDQPLPAEPSDQTASPAPAGSPVPADR